MGGTEHTPQGYDVRYADNRGYDFEVRDSLRREPLCVEVKGTSTAAGFIVELTPNQFEKMRAKRSTYRICVVVSTLGAPDLREFFYETGNGHWIDADTVQRLVISARVAAPLTV